MPLSQRTHRTIRFAAGAGLFALLLVSSITPAQPVAPSKQPASRPAATRADLAAAYLRFEAAYRAHAPAPGRLAEVNRAFDRATLSFFAGRGATAIDELDGLTRSLLPDGAAAEALPVPADPWADRPDEITLAIGKARVPGRLYVPPGDARGTRPLVIALHGAGGDESMFMVAYGSGRLKALALEKDFVLLSPATLGVLPNQTFLADAIEAVSAKAPIDADQVYLIGHSLGAAATTAVTVREGDRLAGLCLIASGGRVDLAEHLPRTLLVAGGIDPIVPAARVRAAYEKARTAGKDVELRELEPYGHTLIVGDQLPQIVDWLLRR